MNDAVIIAYASPTFPRTPSDIRSLFLEVRIYRDQFGQQYHTRRVWLNGRPMWSTKLAYGINYEADTREELANLFGVQWPQIAPLYRDCAELGIDYYMMTTEVSSKRKTEF